TRFSRDWSSDVCSSDLEFCLSYNRKSCDDDGIGITGFAVEEMQAGSVRGRAVWTIQSEGAGNIRTIKYGETPASWVVRKHPEPRSEERRVGKECRTRRG